MSDDDVDYVTVIHVCSGEPRCLLKGDEVVAAQRAGCVWCTRIIMNHRDGTEIVKEPGHA